MSVGDILAVVTILVSVGKNLYDRIDSMKQGDGEISLLNSHLQTLLNVFEELGNDVVLACSSELVRMLGILKSIQESYNKCARVLGVTPGAVMTGHSLSRRVIIFARIPGILTEIRCKAEQLQKITDMLSVSFLFDVRKRQRALIEREAIQQTVTITTTMTNNSLDSTPRTGFAGIDQVIENLMKECKRLQDQLQKNTLAPDASAIREYEAHNPEGVSFWKDRFQKDQLYASTFRYETFYVSWARFVHEVEKSFVLKMMPTATWDAEDIASLQSKGSRYSIDEGGVRHLPAIRPLWLPALRSALDPLHRGYVKPEDYFNLIQDSSLSETLRRLVLESAGYGTLIECERASNDLALPAAVETPSGHIGWIAAQIVAVPTSVDLGIIAKQDIIGVGSDDCLAYFNEVTGDIHVYVRYLQTGQIERKSLSRQIRPIGGISIGAALSIRDELDSNRHTWSRDLRIIEFKACQGGDYMITAGDKFTSVEFCTQPLRNSGGLMLHADNGFSPSAMPRLDLVLLGPSKVFTHPPQVGEKIQVEHNGVWYDSRITAIDGDEIEFVDWTNAPKQDDLDATQGASRDEADDEEVDNWLFTDDQLIQLGKGTRRFWRLWQRDIDRYDVRPYRCFHIGDVVEAPVMYPDFRMHYHDINSSQLYLPARIVDARGDQYVIEFSPAFFVHPWWPGRIPQGETVDLQPGLGTKLENPFDLTRVVVAMDRVRPFNAGPRPALSVQSATPFGWGPFQGLHLRELDDLLEKSLWDSDQQDEQAYE